MTIASQLTSARAHWSAILKRATLTPYSPGERFALGELVNAFDYAISQFTSGRGAIDFGSDTSQYYRDKIYQPFIDYWLRSQGEPQLAEEDSDVTTSDHKRSHVTTKGHK